MSTSRRRRPPAQPAWTPGAGIADAPGGDPGASGDDAPGPAHGDAGGSAQLVAGPAGAALAAIDAATSTLAGLLTAGDVAGGELAGLAEALHAAAARLSGAHLAALAAVRAAHAAGHPDALPPGPATPAAWLAATHRLTGTTAAGPGGRASGCPAACA
ncbi:MAG: hypothetical protein E6Q90_05140, partial [Actinobacteria bacterium]